MGIVFLLFSAYFLHLSLACNSLLSYVFVIVLIRRDRTELKHGGVCVYIKIKFTVVDDLEDPSFEVLWIQSSPTVVLPWRYSSSFLGVF